jgi:hypothetical protein
MKAFVTSPKPCISRQADCRQEMDIDISDPESGQSLPLDKFENLPIGRGTGLGQVCQGSKNDPPRMQITQREFADDKWMCQDLPGVEKGCELPVARAQMLHPDRRIGQDHERAGRRRGGAFSLGWVPPRRANRRALSRSMSALSASRTRLDFSLTPVNAWALATSSSSRAMVVRMARFCHRLMPISMPAAGAAPTAAPVPAARPAAARRSRRAICRRSGRRSAGRRCQCPTAGRARDGR